MEFRDAEELRRVCAERLGERAGAQFARLARRGFRLEAATEDAPPTGRCRLGGAALLEPGTAWPAVEGVPLSLHAVLDTDALAPWLGAELPVRPGLLNFFYLDPEIPYEEFRELGRSEAPHFRVLAADPGRAVEVPAPTPARRYPARPVHAVGSVMLPDCWDVEDGDFEYDRDAHWGAQEVVLLGMDGHDGNTAGRHCAFGWPDTSYSTSVTRRDADGPLVNLLQLAADGEFNWGWGDNGSIYFGIPAAAYAAGDFDRVEWEGRCC
ncbi:DUF1963 domain-containing protein [Kitasatospora sp. NPDC057198]|uniref:DUF1963 domain-containing protein n=1 Tax=Kitasatospora sp. NPDC057198 TaxID=3346046 RepID=UPI003643B51C